MLFDWIDDVWLKIRNLEPKKWGLSDIVGIFSTGVKMTVKVWFKPMETTIKIPTEICIGLNPAKYYKIESAPVI